MLSVPGVASGGQPAGEKLLIFPAGMPRALAFRKQCELSGIRTVGASSLSYDPAASHYAEWRFLPYVVAEDFPAALLELIRSCGITGIFTANPVVWDQLAALLPKIAPGVRVVNPAPAAVEEAPYLEARAVAQRIIDQPLSLSDSMPLRPAAPPLELAGILKLVDSVPGMCDDDKVAALCEIARSAPEGDVVEIGTWWGKSAMLLGLLARSYRIGPLLCVDPWSDGHLLQKDSTLVDDSSQRLSAQRAFEVFTMNLAPVSCGTVNYIREPSVEAAALYAKQRTIENESFGRTAYSGRISILHVDGNHDLSAVQADIDAWGPFVEPAGGWVIFDDYRWPYGNGPRVVADRFCAVNAGRVARAFAMGGALFVQLHSG